jgi:hypothetical protein
MTETALNSSRPKTLRSIVTQIDDVLRGRPWVIQQGHPLRRLAQFALLIALFGIIYGGVMGGFGGEFGPRFRQISFSALKVPLLLIATFAISLPNFFVLNTLAGLRADFSHAVRALAATQAGLTIILASFAPFTVLWYVSCASYQAAILFNALMFGCASFAAQQLLRRFYEPLIARHPRHRWLLRAWLIIYAFVGIQMAWILRPFVGDPYTPTHFFRQGAWGNAYEKLASIAWHLLRAAF